MREIWQSVAEILPLVISAGTVLTVTLPGLRRLLAEWILRASGAERLETELSGVRSLLEQHVAEDREKKEELKLQREVDKCVLRDLITNMYHKHLEDKTLTVYELEDATALHDLYRRRGGNSYVHHIFRQMTEEWDVVQ